MSAGRLRIFLGMCPGVGKTYPCCWPRSSVRRRASKWSSVGSKPTARIETAALTAGLRRIPPREFEHRGVALEEMDLDAILERRPTLVLVDELAHTNVPGSRHPKRYQDVLEILEAGIDVYSTVNVQHLESLRDAVAGITGVAVRETLPDSVLDHAAEIELIDVTPEQLRARLGEGKVYGGDRADRAADAFFREGNLRALREMALRVVADRADRQVRGFLKDNAIQGPWRSRERLMVAVGGSPHAEGLIRITKRIADALDATWIAVHVEAGDAEDESTRARTAANLSLARSLGAETISVSGTDPVEALLDCSRRENATQIVLGKTTESTWWSRLAGTGITERLARQSGGVDLLLVHSDEAAAGPTARLHTGRARTLDQGRRRAPGHFAGGRRAGTRHRLPLGDHGLHARRCRGRTFAHAATADRARRDERHLVESALHPAAGIARDVAQRGRLFAPHLPHRCPRDRAPDRATPAP